MPISALESVVRLEPGASCLETDRLIEHIASWLGTSEVDAALSIAVQGSPQFSRMVWFRITRAGATLAERTFQPGPTRCEDLHAALGLAIALALKASLIDALSSAKPTAPSKPRPWLFAVQGLAGYGVLPGADFGATLLLSRALSKRVAARLAVVGLLGPYGSFHNERGTFDTRFVGGTADVCSSLVSGRHVGFSVCLGVSAGALRVQGRAFEPSRSALISYVALANALDLGVELRAHWSLRIAVNVLVPLRRTRFLVRSSQGAVVNERQVAAVGVLLAVGPAYLF